MFEKLYKKIFPILNFIPPELAHNLAIRFFTNFKNKIKTDDLILNIKVCNLKFTNPIGLAAGFDKNGKAYDGLMRLGFGFVEMADEKGGEAAIEKLNGSELDGRSLVVSQAKSAEGNK